MRSGCVVANREDGSLKYLATFTSVLILATVLGAFSPAMAARPAKTGFLVEVECNPTEIDPLVVPSLVDVFIDVYLHSTGKKPSSEPLDGTKFATVLSLKVQRFQRTPKKRGFKSYGTSVEWDFSGGLPFVNGERHLEEEGFDVSGFAPDAEQVKVTATVKIDVDGPKNPTGSTEVVERSGDCKLSFFE